MINEGGVASQTYTHKVEIYILIYNSGIVKYNPWCTYSPLVPKRDTFMLETVQPWFQVFLSASAGIKILLTNPLLFYFTNYPYFLFVFCNLFPNVATVARIFFLKRSLVKTTTLWSNVQWLRSETLDVIKASKISQSKKKSFITFLWFNNDAANQ